MFSVTNNDILNQNAMKCHDKNHDMTWKDTSNNKEIPRQYNPYMNNEGSTLGFIGKDYMVLGADTRLSSGYSIVSRDSKKIFKLTDKVFLAAPGMYADIINLVKNLRIRIELYRDNTKFDPSIENIAQLLSTTLYGKRFFPYYAFNILGGINDKGEFKIYGYDAIGSFDCLEYASQGSGKELIMPVLDSFLYDCEEKPDLETGEKLALTALNSCANRDIYTGDKANLLFIFKDGRVEEKTFELRKD